VRTEILAATLGRRSWHRHPADPSGLEARATTAAVELLRKGDVVALPTETVYGLAADALDPIAVSRIFEAKERPRFDPLIVHLPDQQWLERVATVDKRSRAQIKKLIAQFWPGPLTLVLARQPIVPEIVTAGLETVAVRRISPTTAQHVFDELSGRIPLIIDAGPTMHGIESTIVAVHEDKIRILRHGPITAEELCGIGFQPMPDRQDADATCVHAPGQLPSHYAPATAVQLVDDATLFVPKPNQTVALLAWNPHQKETRFTAIRHLSARQDLREAAANLFRSLRELDDLDLDLIVAERVPAQGLGAAILDRLERASHDSDN
jgi:L-threonylcarbamoyladenylate synthase